MINESYDPANIALIAALANGEGGGGGGGGDVDLKDVNYFDCFGNVLYAYTAAEFAQLSDHPTGTNISSKGVPLTFDSWNYTLANAKTYVSKYGKLNIGGTYHPTDNKTHIFLDIKSAAYSNIDIRFTATTTATVDWGDGTTETVSGAFTSKHNYNDSGVFEITIDGAITLSSDGLLPDLTQAKYLTDAFLSNNATIGDKAFVNCSSLVSVTIPDGTTSITASCFSICTALKYITIPGSVTSINSNGLNYCSSLTIVTIPDSVTSIYANAFSNCASLTSINIPEGITSVGNYIQCSSLKSITIPNSVTSIGTFDYCECLKSIPVPNSVTSIGSFQYCHSLESITIPSGTVNLSNFRSGYSLTSITFPASVAYIPNNAFESCMNIVYLDFSKATAIPTLNGTGVFNSMLSLSAIIVPDDLYDSWIVANRWSTQASKIVKASEYIKPF